MTKTADAKTADPTKGGGEGLRERKKRHTRDEIVGAAFELFAEHGYEATTVEMIAEAAMVSPRTVFRYFDRKADIVFAGSDEASERLVARLARRYEQEPTLRGLVEAFAERTEEVQAEETSATRSRIVRQHPELADLAALWRQRTADAIAEALAEVDGEPFPSLGHRTLARMVIAIWIAASDHHRDGRTDQDLPSLVRAAGRIVTDGAFTTTG